MIIMIRGVRFRVATDCDGFPCLILLESFRAHGWRWMLAA